MGNEKVRQQGRREMKEAAALRTYRRQHGSSGKPSGGGFLFGMGKGTVSPRNSAPKRHTSSRTPARGHSQRQAQGHIAHRPSQSRRPSNHRHGDSRHTSPRSPDRGRGGASGGGGGVSRKGTSGGQSQRSRQQISAGREVAIRRPSGRR